MRLLNEPISRFIAFFYFSLNNNRKGGFIANECFFVSKRKSPTLQVELS